ncbi:VWA domain-containing protein [Akkermansiaceae bacterium]|nr:VWA domain-containing protein [Akkermansiaceae bacterium]
MNFAKPEWLLCLTALPLIGFMAWLSWKKRRYRWKRMVAHRLQGRLSHTRPPWVHFTSLGLALGGMAGLIIAVAQPESGEEWIEVENEGRNILFCVDISRSMLARDIEPNRLLASRAAALEILEKFPNDRVGVLLFSGETLVQSPLTIDHSFVEQTLAQLDPNDIPVGGSNLTTAIDSGTRLLRETGQQSNIMVVFSDGEKSSEGLEEAAAAAAREGIFIYAIGMGSTEGSFIPDPRESDGNFRDRSGNVVFSKLNEEALQVIAEETDGYYSKGMGAGFINKLDSALSEMDRFREEGKHQRVAKPAHRWFVFSGLLLIMTSIFIKCLPLAPIIALAVCSLATPQAEASLVEDGIAALKAGETTTAQQLFSEAAKDSSGDHAASLYLASGSAASRAQDWPTAVTSFSSALSAEDSEILQQAHYALATSLFYLGASKNHGRESESLGRFD